MNIYAYGTPERDDDIKFIYDSLMDKEKPISRYLYSWFSNCDLNRLKKMEWQNMNKDEQKSWYNSHWLLDFKPGDWIMHINVPEYGLVTAAQINSDYFYQDNLPNDRQDGRHCFYVHNVFTFDRNDTHVHRMLSARLKLRGHLWRIKGCDEPFEELLKFLNSDNKIDVDESWFLTKEIKDDFHKITETIQRNNPGKDLEVFLSKVFGEIPGVTRVEKNGFGWGTDNGADLIIKYQKGLLEDYEEPERTMVVQVKSYQNEHWETNAVKQLETAIEKFNASVGMLMTTGKTTKPLEEAMDKLAEKMMKKNVSVHLIADVDFAIFVMKYGMKYII